MSATTWRMRILEEVTGDSCQEPEAERPEIGRGGDQSARSRNGAGLEIIDPSMRPTSLFTSVKLACCSSVM